MKRVIARILILSLLASSELVLASSPKDEGKVLNINVEIGKVSEVVFPAKVTKVIKGGQPDSILVEVLDHSVYLLPKTDTPPDIFVTTTAGSSYPLSLHLSQEHDIKVQVDSSARSSGSLGRNYNDVMDLMKDLLLQKELSMATVLPSQGEVLLSNQEIKLTVDKAYELGDWKAYVLTAKNLISNAVIIPIEQITLPNLLAISADQDMLFASGQQGDNAKVYMIVSAQ
jgi:hypothetical protein